jgi:hypothetical protein
MSRDGKRRRGLSYEDRVLWTHVTKAITPLRPEAIGPADDGLAETADVSPPKKHPPKFSKPAAQPRTAAAPLTS